MTPVRTTLDCGSLELSLTSIAELTGLRTAAIVPALTAVAPDTLEWHPDDEIFRRAFQRDDIPIADVIHWYHVSRTWPDFQFEEGILPLAQAEPELWRRLGDLASEWVDDEWWQQFKSSVGKEGNPADSNYTGRRSVRPSWGGGPYAFLIREVIGEATDDPYHYVHAGETVADICCAFQARTGKDLLTKFQAATQPVIVKFRSPSQYGNEILHAVNYAYSRVHGLEVNRDVTLSFSGGGVAVPRRSILSIEEIRRVGAQSNPDESI